MGGLLVKVVGSSAVDAVLIPGRSQLRQEIAKFCCLKLMIFFKTWPFNPILNEPT